MIMRVKTGTRILSNCLDEYVWEWVHCDEHMLCAACCCCCCCDSEAHSFFFSFVAYFLHISRVLIILALFHLCEKLASISHLVRIIAHNWFSRRLCLWLRYMCSYVSYNIHEMIIMNASNEHLIPCDPHNYFEMTYHFESFHCIFCCNFYLLSIHVVVGSMLLVFQFFLLLSLLVLCVFFSLSSFCFIMYVTQTPTKLFSSLFS